MRNDKHAIRQYALELVAADGRRVGSRLAAHFGVSRQVANGYLSTLLAEGLVDAEGSTQARVYRLRTLAAASFAYPRDGLQEDIVWRQDVAPLVADLPANVRGIWGHGVTEMVNNAIDHSGSIEVRVEVTRNAVATAVRIADDGEGIFLKIQRALGLFDAREAILELAKGKLTTAPAHHSGEGIFFTSRAMDVFEIRSGRLVFSHSGTQRDVLTEGCSEVRGTEITMRLANASTRTLREVFDAYADPAEYSFDRTVVPLRLAQHEGEKLVSRSQAKRVAHRFERFKLVQLDFAGVEEIGQAFADELFRVFASAHPDVQLVPINTAEPVAHMIRRATAMRSNLNDKS
jgi:hypothetical protein